MSVLTSLLDDSVLGVCSPGLGVWQADASLSLSPPLLDGHSQLNELLPSYQ